MRFTGYWSLFCRMSLMYHFCATSISVDSSCLVIWTDFSSTKHIYFIIFLALGLSQFPIYNCFEFSPCLQKCESCRKHINPAVWHRICPEFASLLVNRMEYILMNSTDHSSPTQAGLFYCHSNRFLSHPYTEWQTDLGHICLSSTAADCPVSTNQAAETEWHLHKVIHLRTS